MQFGHKASLLLVQALSRAASILHSVGDHPGKSCLDIHLGYPAIGFAGVGVVAQAELVDLVVQDLLLDAVGTAVQLGVLGPVMAGGAVLGFDAPCPSAAGDGIQLTHRVALVAGNIHRVKAGLGPFHHPQSQGDEVVHIDVIPALVAVGVELRRAVLVQLTDHIPHKRRLLAQTVDVGP